MKAEQINPERQRPIPVQLVTHEQELTLKQIIAGHGDRIISVPPSASVLDVLEILDFEDVAALVVSRDGKAIDGIISERDIVRGMRFYSDGIFYRNAADLMSIVVVTCDVGCSADNARTIMKHHNVRHLPVLHDGRLAGLVSVMDVINAWPGRA